MSRTSPVGPRTMRLRRPPTLQVVAEPFLPQSCSIDDIDARWEAMCAGNPRLFDGPTYHVLGVHRNGSGGVVLHVVETTYRYFAVQQPGFDLGVRGLGVRGITKHGGQFLLGRRGTHTAMYPGQWEFLPAGTMEPGTDPADLLMRELKEETGLVASRLPLPVAVIFDPESRTWQLVYQFDNVKPEDFGQERIVRSDLPEILLSDEHDCAQWCAAGRWPDGLSPVDQLTAGLISSR